MLPCTRCQILRPKFTKFDFGWGSAPDPAGGVHSAPDSLVGFRGPTSKGEGRKGTERGGDGRGGVDPQGFAEMTPLHESDPERSLILRAEVFTGDEIWDTLAWWRVRCEANTRFSQETTDVEQTNKQTDGQRHCVRLTLCSAALLDFNGNYSVTSNNTKLVHWPLMGGLLHLVQRGRPWPCPVPSSLYQM